MRSLPQARRGSVIHANAWALAFLSGAALLFCSPVRAQAPEALLSKAGCIACHTKDKKMVGPSFKDIAAKYKDQKDAAPKLAEKVRKGGSGVWGPIPMPPHGSDKLSDADLKSVVDYILGS